MFQRLAQQSIATIAGLMLSAQVLSQANSPEPALPESAVPQKFVPIMDESGNSPLGGSIEDVCLKNDLSLSANFYFLTNEAELAEAISKDADAHYKSVSELSTRFEFALESVLPTKTLDDMVDRYEETMLEVFNITNSILTEEESQVALVVGPELVITKAVRNAKHCKQETPKRSI